ncbi:DUF2071 domain-containing protein [Chitinophaga silvatica]|uniref:DUF2071 domain-containing protein n=1 Tax=Chitinophaga silvatica TaxID=2282649 RepID=A0A3E1YC89_9BACT|nr:DUF2071 domain-containing protein [Chitinophaga silvatica]RFS23876.1 DUF2071 domain-containing protein [Chitinophaga silvatica]
MQPFLTANWKNLLLFNFEADPALLRPYLPAYTELDFFGGKTYLSLVGFLFEKTKLKGISVPAHQTFEEVNLRFYVRYKEAGKWKRGVAFIKELVPKPMITFVANTLYNEKYATLPMKHKWEFSDQAIEISYQWKLKDTWNFLTATANKESIAIEDNSENEFILEHYWGYTQINNKLSGEYEVKHPKWMVHPVRNFNYYCDTLNLYGEAFVPALQQPGSVILATGSEIEVMPGRKIRSIPL